MKNDRFPISPGVVTMVPLMMTFVSSASVATSSRVIDCADIAVDFLVAFFFAVLVFAVDVFVAVEDALSVTLVGDFGVG